MFAYCENSPVGRKDVSGNFWETAFDVISLASSIVEVSVNPADPWAWAGLAGDVIDLLPFVTGVGETTRAINTTVKLVNKSDNVVDAARALYRASDSTSDIRKATGAYEILFKSGKNYVGKGGFYRAITSAVQKSGKYGDEAASILWKSSPNARHAFVSEYLMQLKRGVTRTTPNAQTYNQIWSPGKKIIQRMLK